MIGGGNAADKLQQAMLPVADHKTCREKMKEIIEVREGPMLCAGGQGKGGCNVRTRLALLHLSAQAYYRMSSLSIT